MVFGLIGLKMVIKKVSLITLMARQLERVIGGMQMVKWNQKQTL